jgi:tetratricopeptide (TPR) repeat protein
MLSSWVQDQPVPAERSEPHQPEPDDALTRTLLAEAATALSAGEYEKSQRLLTQAMERSPESSKVRFALGTHYVKRKQYSEAVKVLEALAEEDPQNFRVRNNLAWIYCTAEEESVRDSDKAIRMAQEALLIASDNFHVWSTLAESHYLAGNYQRAMRAAEEAVRLSVEQRADPVYRQQYLRQFEKCRTALSEQAGTE